MNNGIAQQAQLIRVLVSSELPISKDINISLTNLKDTKAKVILSFRF